MLPEDELADALRALSPLDLHGPWYRAVFYRYLILPPPEASLHARPQPLWTGGPPLVGGRFTPIAGARTIYLASDPETAMAEVAASVYLCEPVVLFGVRGIVSGVLDLTDPVVQTRLHTSHAELTGDWKLYQEQGHLAPQQWLGRAAAQAGFGGVLYRSAVRPAAGLCLAVFEEAIVTHPPCFLEVIDAANLLPQRIPER